MAERKEVTGREIALRLTGMVHAFLAGRLRASELVTELRAVADWLEGNTKPARPAVEQVDTQVEAELFQYWQARCNKPRAKFTQERRRCLRARLREGYTAVEIRRAIDGCADSPFHSGENDTGHLYNDLTLILRNGTKLERFRDMAKESGAKALPVQVDEELEAEIERLTEESSEALQRGDTNAYNRTERQIQKLRTSRKVPAVRGAASA